MVIMVIYSYIVYIWHNIYIHIYGYINYNMQLVNRDAQELVKLNGIKEQIQILCHPFGRETWSVETQFGGDNSTVISGEIGISDWGKKGVTTW